MSGRQSIALTAIMLLWLVSPAQADDRITVGGFLGLHAFSDPPAAAVGFGARAGFEVRRHIRIETELLLVPPISCIADTEPLALSGRVLSVLNFVPTERLQPFALVGAGFTKQHPDFDVSVVLGFGAAFEFNESFALRTDARLVADHSLATDLEFFVGLQKRFAHPISPPPTDRDGDGVFDDRDRCPTELEDQDGYADEDGCPDIDNDGDGILDHDDLCPSDAGRCEGGQRINSG